MGSTASRDARSGDLLRLAATSVAVLALLASSFTGLMGASAARAAADGTTPVAMTASAASPQVSYGTANTVRVTGLPAAATGAVDFVSGSTPLCRAVLPASACATPATLPIGSYPVTATYSGDDVYESATAVTAFSVSRASAPFSAGHASSVPYGTANTISVFGFPSAATGSVAIATSGRTLCTIPDITTGSFCQTPTDLAVGTYPFTISYSGDQNHNSRTVGSSFRVVPASTRLDARVRAATVPFGTPNMLEISGLPSSATGSVVFTAGVATLCRIDDVTAASSCSTAASLGAGTYAVTATYGGDASYGSSTASTGFEVTRATVPDFDAEASAASVEFGSSVVLGVDGLPSAATGSVVFTADGATLCRIADVTASATCSTPADLGAGTYTVTAAYSGDANHRAATAATGFEVTRAELADFDAAPAAPAAAYGSGIVLRYSGLPSAATGSVVFTSGSTVLCTIADVRDADECRTAASLDAGRYLVLATYSGDADHAAATSTSAFDVEQVATAIEASARARVVAAGEPNTLTLAGLPGAATGSVSFSSGALVLCTVDDISAADRCDTPADLGAGEYEVTVRYSGDRNHLASTARTAFAVEAATPLTPAPASEDGDPGELPATGDDPTAPLVWALALLLAGAALGARSSRRVRRRDVARSGT
ncbi:Ig-like domain-containing protein [Homoserinibacter sp. YIM 151385]|uniref:Ig-like domain-containing protein n=1 Tax=Homoserinibacter sp. YIM 151385 TaxID=2985506 RepID=UPI0022F0BBD3|nr:Ig-like domain-containing protein [Homoserinibacter sp. YIM 151385]WBU37495.1 Ig-like domain-containing protein [Homoserinibacter sp. YIM 151385]